MGLALLRAQFLEAVAWQLAVWDRQPPIGPAGTAVDVAKWNEIGHDTDVVEVHGGSPTVAAVEQVPGDGAGGRVVRSLPFADVRGYSRLPDEAAPRFAKHVLGALAGVLGK